MMTNTICIESQNVLKGITNRLCDIAVFSRSLMSTNRLEITNEERKAFQHAMTLAQMGAATLETYVLSLADGKVIKEADPLVQTGAKMFDAIINEISITGYLTTHIIQRYRYRGADKTDFESQYPALALKRKARNLRKAYQKIDCQHKQYPASCHAQGRCLIATWKAQRTKKPINS